MFYQNYKFENRISAARLRNLQDQKEREEPILGGKKSPLGGQAEKKPNDDLVDL